MEKVCRQPGFSLEPASEWDAEKICSKFINKVEILEAYPTTKHRDYPAKAAKQLQNSLCR